MDTSSLAPLVTCDALGTVRYRGGGRHALDHGTARGARGWSGACRISYFELEVVVAGETGCVRALL